MFDVFVSFKCFNADGTPTVENQMAQMLAAQFEQAGIRAFFSEGSYRRAIQPSYGTTVDNALTGALVMLVLCAEPYSVSDHWVEYEWRYFANAVNSGVKQGCLLTVLDGVSPFELPPALANSQSVDAAYLGSMAQIVANLLEQINSAADPSAQNIAREVLIGDEYYPTDLVELEVCDRGVADISELVWLRELRSLRLSGNRIADISALTALSQLERLDLTGNRITDISPISALVGLRELELSGNYITGLEPLARLTGLECLRMWHNRVRSAAPLAGLAGLRELELSGNHIADVSPLANLTGLVTLELGANEIEDISPLANLTGLRSLWLNNNRIEDISPIAALTGLETLHLEGNAELTDLTPLYDMPHLHTIWITDCPGVSADAAMELRSAQPGCAVIF